MTALISFGLLGMSFKPRSIRFVQVRQSLPCPRIAAIPGRVRSPPRPHVVTLNAFLYDSTLTLDRDVYPWRQIGRRKAIQLELLLASMAGSTKWFLDADYDRVMQAVKDFLHEQVRDATLGAKEHRKAAPPPPRPRATHPLRTVAPDRLVSPCGLPG